MIERIRALVAGGSERVLYECRHCGAAVEGPCETCPDCGTGEIACFTL